MQFTVNKAKWYRGMGSEDSRLLREDGYRCCLGFVGAQVGVNEDDMLGVCAPCEIWDNKNAPVWPTWMYPGNANGAHSEECNKAMLLNDDDNIHDDERIAKLKELFARNGDELRFQD